MSLHFLAGYVLGEHGRQSARLAAAAGAVAGGARREDVHELHDRVDRLTLVVAAMWSLLQEQGFDEAALAARIRELDEADGVADGKTTARPNDCRSCGAKVGAGLEQCQFCGAAVLGDAPPDPFAAI
jgi:hypothetical protein